MTGASGKIIATVNGVNVEKPVEFCYTGAMFLIYPNPVTGGILHVEIQPGYSISSGICFSYRMVNVATGEVALINTACNSGNFDINVYSVQSGVYSLIISTTMGSGSTVPIQSATIIIP
jgi:hypothetical protein